MVKKTPKAAAKTKPAPSARGAQGAPAKKKPRGGRRANAAGLPAPSVEGLRPNTHGLTARADGTERARLSVYLDLETAQKLRKYCFDNNLRMSDVAERAIGVFVAALK